jgi:peroxiredoxin
MKAVIKYTVMLITGFFIFTSFAPPAYKVGDNAKDFSLKNVNGKMVSLANYPDAKGFIVVFTCNHCPYAKAYEQRIMDLDKNWKPKGYPVIAISANDPVSVPDDSYDNMVKRAKEKDYTFPYLFDESQSVAKTFGAMRTPQVYVLQKTEKGLEVRYIGAIDDNTEDPSQVQHHYVDDAVNALLKGTPVPVTETKAVGCTIKWKS